MTSPANVATGASRDGVVAARHLARWLALAATPTFAIMAVLTAVLGGPADMLCAAGYGSVLERDGADVSADERVSFSGVAEADRGAAAGAVSGKRLPPV